MSPVIKAYVYIPWPITITELPVPDPPPSLKWHSHSQPSLLLRSAITQYARKQHRIRAAKWN
jgi:hypothetical protein